MIRQLVLGLNFPIVVLAFLGAFAFVRLLVLPALEAGGKKLSAALIGIGAALSLIAHDLTHGFSWLVRSGVVDLSQNYLLIGAINLVALAACCCAVGGLTYAVTGKVRGGLILLVAGVLWALGIWVTP